MDLDISMRSAVLSDAETSFEVPSLPPTSPVMAHTDDRQADLSGFFHDPSSPDFHIQHPQRGRHDHFQCESSPLASPAVTGYTRSTQQQQSPSLPPSLGVGSKKRRSSEFEEEGGPSKTGSSARRSLPKRPPLASLQAFQAPGHIARAGSSSLALPGRRAFSAGMPKPLLGMGIVANGSDDCDIDDNDVSSDFDLSIDSFGHEISELDSNNASSKLANAHSPAQRAQMARRENVARFGNRYNVHARGGNAVSPVRNPGVAARSLPGFGDSEADGKVLPCHKVREDGLMRISADTLVDLIHGLYDEGVESYTIVDCRFDYEHSGGRIPGAINLNTNEAIEAALLDPNGTECLFGKPPAPSRSGDGQGRKRVLVFHCEFSKKRAPTFAKHLRSKDRSMNGQVYPNIHYPEVYILEGGYAQYYSQFPVSALCGSCATYSLCCPILPQNQCEGSYVRMDDPAHQRARACELNDFRRWNRARSYTYGELQRVTRQAAEQVPSGQPSGVHQRAVSTDVYMPGGNASSTNSSNPGGATKRSLPQSTLHTLTEDGDSSFTSEPDPAESPCPPAGGKMKFMPFKPFATGGLGSFKPRGMRRALTTALVSARH